MIITVLNTLCGSNCLNIEEFILFLISNALKLSASWLSHNAPLAKHFFFDTSCASLVLNYFFSKKMASKNAKNIYISTVETVKTAKYPSFLF